MTLTVQDELAAVRAEAADYKARLIHAKRSLRDKLLLQIDDLEEEIRGLEVEDLRPLVDRVRGKVLAIRKQIAEVVEKLADLEDEVEGG